MNILRVEKSLPSKNFYSNRILRGNNHNEANAVPDFRIIIIIILSYYFVCIIFLLPLVVFGNISKNNFTFLNRVEKPLPFFFTEERRIFTRIGSGVETITTNRVLGQFLYYYYYIVVLFRMYYFSFCFVS